MARLRPLLPPLAGIAALTALVAAAFGAGRLLNYDTAYSLLWGSELAGGSIPDVQVAYAPTQHPLATALGFLLTLPGTGGLPHGETAMAIWELLGLVFLGVLGWLVWALGRAWFGAGAGLVAAAIVLTREPVLSFGVRAYVDIPYLCLLLGALLVETRRPRAGGAVLGLLALAGLLRPEAWLFSLAYLAWLRHNGVLRPAHLAIAACGPGLWALTDLIQTGNPIASFTETHEAADKLGRVTGIQNVPETLPRRLGEILREPGLLAAAGGGVLAWLHLRDRARLPAVAGVLAVAAFVVLATAGLPILTRYLLLPATILAVFAGAGLFGWTQLEPGHRWRHRWMAFAALCAALFAGFGPGQVDRLQRTERALRDQRAILGELRTLSPAVAGPCRATVPNRRPVPHLAMWTGHPPTASARRRRTAATRCRRSPRRLRRSRRSSSSTPATPSPTCRRSPPAPRRCGDAGGCSPAAAAEHPPHQGQRTVTVFGAVITPARPESPAQPATTV